MGGIHAKAHKSVGPKCTKNIIPERRNYRVVQKKNGRSSERINELDSLQSAYNRLFHVNKLSTRASTPYLSINRNELEQLCGPLKEEEILRRGSGSNVTPSPTSDVEKEKNLPRRLLGTSGHVRYSQSFPSDQRSNCFDNDTSDSKSSTIHSDSADKLVQFEGGTFGLSTRIASESREDRSQGDDSGDTKVSTRPHLKVKPQVCMTMTGLSPARFRSTPPTTVQIEPGFKGTAADMPIGDANNLIEMKPTAKPKAAKSRVIPCLVDKPPTPPPKSCPTKRTRVNNRSPQPRFRSSSNCRFEDRSKTLPTLRRAPSPPVLRKYSSPRSNSPPMSSEGDLWACVSPVSQPAESTLRQKRCSSTSRHSVTEATSGRSQCLSRIEYTFYIYDTETYQRPFYDKRVEAIARATSCNICLHKPPPGHRSVFYKGMRVLPVTISARTMVSLKRCIARLDIQYPYFNVKAFCPPDMY